MTRLITTVELVRLYSNLFRDGARLCYLGVAASSQRRGQDAQRSGQRQHRLSQAEIAELIVAYHQGQSIRQLARRFKVHRTTVTALLRRQGIELRQAGLAPAAIPAAASLYGQGWSLARLGERFGVDAATVWRALRAAGVEMRMPSQRPTRSD
jgi:transposase